MNDQSLSEEAQAIARLMPKLVRGLFPADHDSASSLPVAQLRVCGILSEGPKPMSAIGRELGVSLSAMTQIADRLERARLVKRVAEDNDRRVRCLQLTPQGEKMMQGRQEARIQRVLAVLEPLTPQARHEIRSALEMLQRACAATQGQNGTSGVEILEQPAPSTSATSI